MANKIANIWIPGMYSIESLKVGEFVKRKESQNKIYRVAGYCRINRAYEIEDMNDISVSRFLKKGKQVFAGFTY